MVLSSTHTFALLEVSDPTYDEVARRLREAEYDQAFMDDGAIDMHGLALVRSEEPLVLEHLKVLQVKPGDTLILTCQHSLSPAAYDRLSALVKDAVTGKPGFEGVEVMVLADGLEMGVMRRTT